MKKVLSLIFTILCLSCFAAMAQMTDSQVVDYVKMASAAGKSETQIGRELLAKGVTTEQLQRIKAQYADGKTSGGTASESSSYVNPRTVKGASSEMKTSARTTRDGNGTISRNGRITQTQTRPRTRQEGEMEDMDEMDDYTFYDEGFGTYDVLKDTSGIFGHSIFYNRELSFEPNENVATPQNYKLGPGDEVIIELWGNNEANIRETISPEGRISISQIGQVSLSGLTVKEATAKLKKLLSAKYESVSNLTVTLGSIRTIQVNVMGEVNTQGTYRLSSFSTVFNALYRAGGVTASGSLRNIAVLRGGKIAGTADIYGYIFNGSTDTDITLQDGDVIMVPTYDKLVDVKGRVKRPMIYELAANESLADVINYAGGFSPDAYREYVSINRNTGKGLTVITAKENEMAGCLMADGDVVTVLQTISRQKGGLSIAGYVFQPGDYQFGGNITTVKQLIRAAGGLREDAFLNRAVIRRENEDLSFTTLSVDLGGIMKGTRPDVPLQDKDLLIVSGKYELQDLGTLTINGMVANPGVFEYSENTTVEDLIILAGGLLDGASLSKVEVSRRVADPYSLEEKQTIGESYTFSIKDGLAVDGADKFYLEPYDVVSVRKSPSFKTQQFVTVEGEVAFPGEYVLQSTGERLSSLIERSGGLTKLAYIKGGKLTRRMTEEEISVAQAAQQLAMRSGKKDTLNVNLLKIETEYTVAVDFEKALANPGSSYDIILREGDRLNIPENIGTVTIKGEVLFPNTVMYVSGKPVSYYIGMAGGYNNNARRSKLYVVYQNGTVSKGLGSRLEPGCEVVVPQKPEREPLNASQILSLGSSAASLATMVVALINIIGK